MRIAIIGGGIGGLVLHLALRARGLASTVFEQSAELAEIGAAVALSANATRELAALGVLSGVEAAAQEPSELIFRDGLTGKRIAAHPVREGGAYRAAFGFPYLGVHRAALQKVLGAAVGDAPLRLGHRLEALEERDDGTVRLRFANGTMHEADLVVGADGVRSRVRGYVTAGAGLRYTGTSAFRGIIPRAELPLLPDPEAIQFWAGPDAHLLHYAIGPRGEDVNLFAVVEGPAEWPLPGSSTVPTAPGEALSHFDGWHPAARQLVERIADKRRWALVVTPRLLHWHRGPVVILGDAAHAMVPHHGQGANTTVEDAVVLASLLEEGGGLPGVLDRFTRLRRRRTALIQRSAWDTNHLLHLRGGDPGLPDRDHRFATFPERFGWIHGFKATAGTGTSPAIAEACTRRPWPRTKTTPPLAPSHPGPSAEAGGRAVPTMR